MRPSKTNASAASGWVRAATSRATRAACLTPGSEVNRTGTVNARAAVTTPRPTPATRPSRMVRRPTRCALPVSPAPRLELTYTCAGTASASSDSASRNQTRMAICWPPSATGPSRAAIAVVVRGTTPSAIVRTDWRWPSCSRVCIPAGPARADLGPAPGRGGVQGGGGDLGDNRAPRRTDQAEVQGVDQEQFESDVQKIGGDGDPQRGPGVGEPDQVAVPGVGEVQEGQARGGNAQVGHGDGQDELVRAEQVREPGRGDEQGDRDGGPGGRGDQVGGAGGAARLLGGPGRGQARHRRGRRGGQEDRQPGRRVQRGGRDSQRVERDAA